MRLKTLIILSGLMLCLACKKEVETSANVAIEEATSQLVTGQDISKLKYIEYTLDSKTAETIKDWAEYWQLDQLVADIKKGDLNFFKDNQKAIMLLLKELKETIPATLNSPSINARLLVLETKILKLESLANLTTTTKTELLESIKEFFVAYYTLTFQMNKKIEFDSRSVDRPQ
jgi:hypothetical protein